MLRWLYPVTIVAASVALASCGAQQGSALSAGVAPAGALITPLKDCAGTGGVKVKPCPVHLNIHHTDGIVVTVKGPGVVNSYLGRINGCHNGRLCYNAERYGSSYTKWLITPGQACGTADVEFDAVNASGGEVGYYFLKVANKYC